MASNTNIPDDGPVDTPRESQIRAKMSLTAPFNLLFGRKAPETMPQNRRIFRIIMALVSQKKTTEDSSKQHQEGSTEPRHKSTEEGPPNGEGDDLDPPFSDQTCTTTGSLSTHSLSNTVPAANGIAIPNRNVNGNGNVNDGGRGRGAFGLEDRLLEFLHDVPGWGPRRVAPSVVDSYHNVRPHFDEDDDDLQFPMDDLFDFDSYYTR